MVCVTDILSHSHAPNIIFSLLDDRDFHCCDSGWRSILFCHLTIEFFLFRVSTQALIPLECIIPNKVSLASYHLQGEANQWWWWLRKAYQEEGKEVQQSCPFREYQKEFEWLGNRVRGWTQKALVGTFMGGLKPEIVDGIRMFKPTNLKDATTIARMRDKQSNRFVGHKCKGPKLRVMESALDEGDYESFVYQRKPSGQGSSQEEAMALNKDRIENLEVTFGQLQDGISEMKIGFADKFQHLEDIITKLSDAVLSGNGGGNYKQAGRLMFYSKLTKIEFPTYRGDEDPTEWFTKVDQFFKNQGIPITQKSQFGLTDCEDFDEALSKVQQMGHFREYQKEFERLGNKVRGWTQKELVGTFMGGLKPEIADGIRMFKQTNLNDATSLDRMRDEQLNRLAMASNKDRIENLEGALGQLQDGIAEMKIGFANKFQHLEDIVTKLSDTVLSGKGGDN
ncbi:retrovirus-related pol polyprotein from transposon 17.6 [Tanacetum coccineum]